jgi:hypothetical protein
LEPVTVLLAIVLLGACGVSTPTTTVDARLGVCNDYLSVWGGFMDHEISESTFVAEVERIRDRDGADFVAPALQAIIENWDAVMHPEYNPDATTEEVIAQSGAQFDLILGPLNTCEATGVLIPGG